MDNAGVIVEAQESLPDMMVTARVGVVASALSDHQEPSSLEGGQDPRVTYGNLLGVVRSGAKTKVSSMACDRSSCISVVMMVAAL